jgi:hypothetical protein
MNISNLSEIGATSFRLLLVLRIEEKPPESFLKDYFEFDIFLSRSTLRKGFSFMTYTEERLLNIFFAYLVDLEPT